MQTDTPPGIILLTPAGPVRPQRQLYAVNAAATPTMSLCVALVTAGVPAVILGLVVARYGISVLWVRALAALTLCLNVAVINRDIRYGLGLFILAAGLSPKLPGFYGNLRVEDFVFVLVFGIWVMKALQWGRIPTVQSPIVLPFMLLTLMSAVATVWGCYLGTVPDLNYSLFLQAKRIEYFLIFWVVATSVRSEGWLRALTVLFVVSGGLAAVYGLTQARNDGLVTVADRRVMGPEGENSNTLSGYLVLCIGVGLATFAGAARSRERALLIVCTAFAGVSLLLGFSREGYIMLVGSLLVFGFTRHRWILFGALAALVIAFTMAEPVREHVRDTANKMQTAGRKGEDVGSNSLTARYSAWQWRWNELFIKQPVVGNGVGSVALSVDNEYLLRACEVGVIGLMLFCWWLIRVGRLAHYLQRRTGITRSLGTGLAAGFVGLLIQGLAAASFTTIRTMEPFWFLLGLACAASMIHRDGGSASTPVPGTLAAETRLSPAPHGWANAPANGSKG